MCKRGVTSPIDVAQLQLEIENELLDLKLEIARQTKVRTVEYQNKFRRLRWDADRVISYNEATSEAKAELAQTDQTIAELKTYRDYFENLSTILRAFSRQD